MKYIIIEDNSSNTIIIKNGLPCVTFQVGIELFDDPPEKIAGKAILSVEVPDYLVGRDREGRQVIKAAGENGVQFADQVFLEIGTITK